MAQCSLDRKNKRESHFYASFYNCGVLKPPQAPGNATVLKRVFRDNFVIFHRRSKKNSIFGINEFFYVCLYANFQFSWCHVTTFRHLSGAYICQMPGHRLSRLAKVTFRVSAFHRYHWFGVKLFLQAVRRIVEGYHKNAKKCCFGSYSATL